MSKKSNHKVFDSAKTRFTTEQDDYIRSLETSVQLLQNEIELLRKKEKTNIQSKTNFHSKEIISNKIREDFLQSREESELIEKLHTAISKEIPIIESNIYLFTPSKKIQPYFKSNTALTLYDKIEHLEEQGIIDWAIEKQELSFIMDLENTSSKKTQYIIIYPIYTRGLIFSIFFALTNLSYEDLEQSKIDFLKSITEDAALALDNIRSIKEIEVMNRRLNHLNNKMMESSLFVSIGEFTSSLVHEMESPISVIKANLDLMESGIGDLSQRIRIVKEQLKIIESFKNKLNELTYKLDEDNSKSIIDLHQIIDNVLFFTNSQFQREGIRIYKEFEKCDLKILGYKSQIEQLLFNLFLNARNYMIDGDEIRINLYREKTNKISLTISDNGKGLTEEEKIKLFEPFNKRDNSKNKFYMSLYYSKQIIERHKGKIFIFSELGKGTTIKITFPSINK